MYRWVGTENSQSGCGDTAGCERQSAKRVICGESGDDLLRETAFEIQTERSIGKMRKWRRTKREREGVKRGREREEGEERERERERRFGDKRRQR
jgi:hypothetical protein